MIFDLVCDLWQVCDEPSPLQVQQMLEHCRDGKIEEAYKILSDLWRKGYSPEDIISNIFRVCKNLQLREHTKLYFLKVSFHELLKVVLLK